MSENTVDIYEDDAGEWRWRAVAGNGETVASGEGHRDPRDAERAFDTAAQIMASVFVKRVAAGQAKIEEVHGIRVMKDPGVRPGAIEVYARDECIFNYCPNPEVCRAEGCQSPRTTTSGGPIT